MTIELQNQMTALSEEDVADRAWPEPPAPARLPEGWAREYESHYSCSAYTLYFDRTDPYRVDKTPEGPPERPHIEVCEMGISFSFLCDHINLSREDWDALMGAVHDDYEHFRACAEWAKEG